jgi:hypothetical protein
LLGGGPLVARCRGTGLWWPPVPRASAIRARLRAAGGWLLPLLERPCALLELRLGAGRLATMGMAAWAYSSLFPTPRAVGPRPGLQTRQPRSQIRRCRSQIRPYTRVAKIQVPRLNFRFFYNGYYT